ncbi:hypothetical protein F0365_08340 [Nonlabens sp. Ci31]|uniref:hypothetical protein n=1 Tax=Nonlabens sp. Ci31 TaxID=2608253 RepID=UPI0014644CCC|nr:hypothetical protein [Nonlabens sp. Ci31]QJP34404.1 hypothetical protein F0365_08340 [Nonlabens sp. Ci31]
MEELNGYWEGYYIYGLGFALPFFGEKVKLFAQLNFKDGKITGQHTKEKGPFSTGKTVNLNGFWEHHMVSITVHYTNNDVILEDGFPKENLEHDFEITYNGYLDLDKKAIYGLWYMEHEINGTLDLEIPPAEGLWMLRKAKKPVSDFDYSLLGL